MAATTAADLDLRPGNPIVRNRVALVAIFTGENQNLVSSYLKDGHWPKVAFNQSIDLIPAYNYAGAPATCADKG